MDAIGKSYLGVSNMNIHRRDYTVDIGDMQNTNEKNKYLRQTE